MNKGPSKRKCSCGRCSNCRHRISQRKYHLKNRSEIIRKQKVLNAAIKAARKALNHEPTIPDTARQVAEYEEWNRHADERRKTEQHSISQSPLEGWT